MPVANIDEAIAQGPNLIAVISYDATESLDTHMGTWIDEMFATTSAVFPPPAAGTETPAPERTVRDWYHWNLIARSRIEGTGNTASGAFGTAAVIDAVVRTCNAAKFAESAGNISAGQLAAVVAAFNLAWP